jgi:WD40 repeat protein
MTLAVAAPSSPYKGLAPFEDSDLDALLFFGREREIEVIAANLIASRITVLYGPSGVGKSSVLRAGVAHRLRQEQGAEVIVFSTWTGDPVAALVEAAGGSGDSLADALADAADRAGGDLYLVLDQFEELFLYHKQGGAFAEHLAQLPRRAGLRVNVLIGMREDSLARLDALKAAIPNLLSNRLRLERLDRLAGTAAILGPVRRYNEFVPADEHIAIEPQLEQAILDEVTAGRVELGGAGRGVPLTARDENRIEAPYLQLVLARLWDVERARGSRTLRLSTLRELGGAERIVEDHLERAMSELTPREKGAAAAMYHFLVTPSGTKIAHGLGDLAGYAAVPEDEAGRVLRRLTSERIVRASSTNGPSTTRYEIFHDVLADAVVAWRGRYEAERALEAERLRHQQRQSRLRRIFAAALVAFAVMAAIAVYALAERSNARHQAAVAETQRAKAQHNLTVAQSAKARETKALRKARASAVAQKRAARLAKAKEKTAREALAAERTARLGESRALGQARVAEGHAQSEAANARRQATNATVARHRAERATRRAVLATAKEAKQRNIAQARKLEADARALLTEDPEASVRGALRAVAASHRARLDPSAVEDTLRNGLLALRVEAVMSNGGAVTTTHFSPDGSLVLVAGRGGAALYGADGKLLRRLRPRVRLTDATFSPDGSLVAGAGADGSARIWDVRSGAEVTPPLVHRGAVLTVAFSPDGKLLATGSADGTARLWLVAGGLPVGEPFVHPAGATAGDDVRMVSFSRDGSRLLTVGSDRYARLFDVARHEKVRDLDQGALVNVARFSHDGSLIATAGGNEIVRIWNARTLQAVKSLTGTGRVVDLAFSPDDTLLATAGGNDTAGRIWNVDKGSSIGVVTAHRSGIESVAFSPYGPPNGPSVLTTGRDGKAYVSRGDSGFPQAVLLGHRESVTTAAFSPDGQTLVTGSDDGTARLWDGRVDRSGPWPPAVPDAVGKHGAVNAVAVSAAGLAVVLGSDGVARLSRPDGSVQALQPSGVVKDASFSVDGSLVVTAGRDGIARIWRVDGTFVRGVGDAGEVLNRARFSVDRKLVVTAGEDGVARVWTIGGAPVATLSNGSPVNDARFSRDGKRIVTAGDDGTVTIWRTAGGSRLQTLTGSTDAILAAAFSPNSALVAASGADFNARVWNARSGRALAVLRVHQGSVNDVAFSADGRWLATAGPGAVGLWETRPHAGWPDSPIYLVRPPTLRINDVLFSPTGWRLEIGSRDGVHTYNCRLCGRVKQLVAIAHRRLRSIVRPG